MTFIYRLQSFIIIYKFYQNLLLNNIPINITKTTTYINTPGIHKGLRANPQEIPNIPSNLHRGNPTLKHIYRRTIKPKSLYIFN